jgi:WD40 repeat protein
MNNPEPADAILILIDVVGYTPQARQAGGPQTREFDAYLKEEIVRRAGDDVHWIKSIGDAALLWCDKPASLLRFVLALFSKDPIPQRGDFKAALRVLAHKDFFTFSQDASGNRIDVHGLEGIIIFRLEKTAHVNRLVVTEHLFRGLRHLLTPEHITYHTEELHQDLKGVGTDSPRQVFILRSPVHEANRDHELPNTYLDRRTLLQQEVQAIPVFGNLYDSIPMRENFLELTLDLQRTARGMYYKWDYPDLRRRFEVDCLTAEKRTRAERSDDLHHLKADQLFDRVGAAVIAGLPGAGKTTILRHFTWKALDDNPHAIVIFVEGKHVHADLLRFAGYQTPTVNWFRLLAALFLQPGIHPQNFASEEQAAVERLAETLKAEFEEHRAIVLLDALDEGPTVEVRKALAELAHALMSNLPAVDSASAKPGFVGRCYLSLRAAELDEHNFTAAPIFLVNPLDQEQIRAIARRRLGAESVEYARFDDQIWRRTDVVKIAGTPLTAMLMVFFFEVYGRFARRYATYRLMVLFVLDRAWQRMKDYEFGPARGGLNPFLREVQEPDYLERHSELSRQVGALGHVARSSLYHTELDGKQQQETERTVSRVEFYDLIQRWLSRHSSSLEMRDIPNQVENWITFWRHDNLLLPSGREHWVFLHSTVLEFLAAESIKRSLGANESSEIAAVFDEDSRDHLETLPLLCSADDTTATLVLTRLGERPEPFSATATLPFRCLVEAETVDREILDLYHDRDLRAEKELAIQNRQGTSWAYDHLLKQVVQPFGADEPAKVKFLDERIADLQGLMPLPRDVLAERIQEQWTYDGSSLARKQGELLEKMLSKEIVESIFPVEDQSAVDSSGFESYLVFLHEFRGDDFAARVRTLKTAKGTSAKGPLDLDLPGHFEDRNLAYYRAAYTTNLLGFLGSANFRMAGAIRCVAVSPDGNVAVSGSADATVTFWDLANGRSIRAFQGHKGAIWGCAFMGDGQHVLSASEDATLKLWHAATGKEIRAFEGHKGPVYACAFSGDGLHVLSGSFDTTLKLWDAATGKEVRAFEGHTGPSYACAFSGDGLHVVSGSSDATLKLWDPATGREVRAFRGHQGSVHACAFSGDGQYVLSASEDATLKLWHAATGKEIRAFEGHKGPVYACAFSGDGLQVLSSSSDATLKLWDAATGKEVRTIEGHEVPVCACSFSSEGQHLLSGSSDHTLKLWEAATGREVRAFAGHQGSVTGCVFSGDGRHVLTGSSDGTLKLWQVATGKEVRAFAGHKGRVTACAFSADGRHVVSSSSDATLKLWDAPTGKEVRAFAGHKAPVSTCVLSDDGRHVLSGSYDRTLKLWDAATGKEVRALAGHQGSVTTCAFSGNGRHVLSGSSDHTLKLWDAATGKEVRAFAGHQGSVTTCVFSGDGRYVLSGSDDRTLKLWQAATGKEVCAFTGHKDSVRACVFSSDGRYVLSGSDDATLKLWDSATGKLLQSWPMPSAVRGVALDPNRPSVAAVALSLGVVALVDTGTGKSQSPTAGAKHR